MESIFVIDDETSITMILQSILSKNFSFPVKAANSYAEGEKLINSGNKPVLIFLDINLGDGNGYNLIPLIRQKETNNTRIVMMSAYAAEGEYANAINNGADHFIAKPFDKKSILEVVNLFLSK